MSIKNILIIVLSCLSIVGCATPTTNSFVSSMLQVNNLPEQLKPNATDAKVFFVAGRTGGTYQLKATMAPGAQFLINGNMVGQLDRNTALGINLAPGSYNFAWRYPAADSRLIFIQTVLKAGDVLILQADWNFQFLGPAEYKLSSISDIGAVLGKQVIGPVNCPSTLCK